MGAESMWRAIAEQIEANPADSYWLKDALRAALRRDVVDAANDAEVLAKVLVLRCDEVLSTHLSLAEGGSGS